MIPAGFKPTLAVKADGFPGPGYVSPKIDGVRCFVFGGVAYGRSGKPFKNKHVQAWAHKHADQLEGLDGEIAFGEMNSPSLCRDTTGFLNRHDDDSPFGFVVFDYYDPNDNSTSYVLRLDALHSEHSLYPYNVSIIPSVYVETEQQFDSAEQDFVDGGFEGMMWRRKDAPYKCGRSTLKDRVLLKVKRFEDRDAFIYGYEEAEHNDNEATTDAFGRTERRSLAEGRRAAGRVGALLAIDLETGVQFKIGIFRGVTVAERKQWFDDPKLIPDFCKYSKMVHGEKDKPRHATYLSPRSKEDIDSDLLTTWIEKHDGYGTLKARAW